MEDGTLRALSVLNHPETVALGSDKQSDDTLIWSRGKNSTEFSLSKINVTRGGEEQFHEYGKGITETAEPVFLESG